MWQRARILTLAGAALGALCLAAGPSVAKSSGSQVCESSNSISSSSQIDGRVKNCKKDDITILLVVTASIAPTYVAAKVCDFSDQILIEDTTDSPGISRLTCNYTGSVRKAR
jgi:hypothetical protein